MFRSVLFVASLVAASPLLAQQLDAGSESASEIALENSESLATPLQPRQLLQRMIESQRLNNYQGSLAFERGDALSTFSLSSRSSEDSTLQSLQPLNRDLSSRLVFSGCSSEKGALLADRMAQLYNFYITGESRVAGRNAYELLLLPLDPYRYGYGFSVDQSSHLMLRTVVMTPQREPLERMEFVALDVQPQGEAPGNAGCEAREMQQTGWSVEEPPPGFELVEEQQSAAADRVKLVYTDGLSTVSILLERAQRIEFPSLMTHLGATNLLLTYASRNGELHRVTLIGEVPTRSLEMMATSLHYIDPQSGPNVSDSGDSLQ